MGDVLDFSDTLNAVENRLKGYELENGTWTRKRTPIVEENSRAFAKVMAVLYSYLGKHIVMSNLTRHYIEISVSNIYTDLYLDFNKNFLEYGFKTKEDIDVILDIIIDNILAAELRAVNGMENKRHYESRKVDSQSNVRL